MNQSRRILYFLSAFIFAISANAQLLPPNQPEQDACNALRMCGLTMTIPYSYQQEGRIRDLTTTPCGGGEGNSMWIQLDIIAAGTIVFTITPTDPLDDYDFAIVQLNGKTCSTIGPADVIRCNFNNNLTTNPGYIGPVVGLDHISTTPFVNGGFTGGNFLQAINAQVGDQYLIMINNFGYSGRPAAGFTIDFAGSTARFATDGLPAYDSVANLCSNTDTLHVWLNNNVLCSSIATDGSDFSLSPASASVQSAHGVGCNGADGYTNHIILKLNQQLPNNRYKIFARTGTDGNTLVGLCNAAQSVNDSISFSVDLPLLSAGNDTITCPGHSVRLNATVSGTTGPYTIQWQPATYLSDPGIPDPVFVAGQDITYTVRMHPDNNPACTVRDTVRIEVLRGFELHNRDTAICIGDILETFVNGDPRYSYSWTPVTGVRDPQSMITELTPEENTQYTLTASFPGCRDSVRSFTTSVDQARKLSAFSFQSDTSVCEGVMIHFTPQADSFVKSLSWNFGDGSNQRNGTPAEEQSYLYAQSGTYTVTMTASFSVCPDSTYEQNVTVHATPIVALGPDTTICPNMDPLLLHNLYNQHETVRHLWNTGDTTDVIRVDQPGLYTLSLYSGAGCNATDSIRINKGCYLHIPNVFTPDGDGRNDYFLPGNILALMQGAVKFNVNVYNRWGQPIYTSSTPASPGWDGRHNGTPLPTGVYIYTVHVTFVNGMQEQYQGNITLLR